MIYCPNKKCKAKSQAEDATYCHLCGTMLVDDAKDDLNNPIKSSPPYSAPSTSSPAATKRTGNRKRRIFAILRTMAIIYIVFWLVFLIIELFF